MFANLPQMYNLCTLFYIMDIVSSVWLFIYYYYKIGQHCG